MFDHLSGELREFFDPLMPHKLISNTELMSAQVTDAIASPVVNCAFLRSGDYVRFKAVGFPIRIWFEHSGKRELFVGSKVKVHCNHRACSRVRIRVILFSRQVHAVKTIFTEVDDTRYEEVAVRRIRVLGRARSARGRSGRSTAGARSPPRPGAVGLRF